MTGTQASGADASGRGASNGGASNSGASNSGASNSRASNSDADTQFEQLDCSAVIADVWLMLDNECDDATRQRLQRHLDDCGSCFSVYGIEEKVKKLVSRKCGGEQAPQGLRERLSVEIRRTVLIRQIELD